MLRTIFLLIVSFFVAVACTSDSKPEEVTLGELEKLDWPPQAGSLMEAWKKNQDDIIVLRDMIAETKYVAVALFGDDVIVNAEDYSRVASDDLDNSDQWATLMKRSNIAGIGYIEGMIAFVVKPPKTENDRTVAISYVYHLPVHAKQCVEEFRGISCGVCDVTLDDEWSIRYTWLSGKFEEEYSENFIKVYQDKEANLSIDDVLSRYDEAKQACLQSGLEEMGYENPEDYFSNDR